ncbi:hypothetical protein H4F05_03690 [Vibrio cholerae]
MKKLAITVAILAATGSSLAQAEMKSAATTISKTVAEECNIGMWATNEDGSVGGSVSEVGEQYVTSELNDLGDGSQSITGKVKCNASGGFKVNVVATNGHLSNNDSAQERTVAYKLDKLPQAGQPFNYSSLFSSAFAPMAGTAYEVGEGSSTALTTFKIKLVPEGSFDYSGVYTETLTFDLVAL